MCETHSYGRTGKTTSISELLSTSVNAQKSRLELEGKKTLELSEKIKTQKNLNRKKQKNILELSNMEKVVFVINQSGIKKSSDFICKFIPIYALNYNNKIYLNSKGYIDSLIDYLIKSENYQKSSEENIFKLICDYINDNPTKNEKIIIQVLNDIYFPNLDHKNKITSKIIKFVSGL